MEKAAERATQAANSIAMKSVPKTAAGFEKDFNQLKKDMGQVHEYLKNIPLKTVESLFKTSEVQAEIFSGILSAFAQHGLKDSDIEKTSQFLVSLSKADNFDMTLMFADDKEKKDLKAIRQSLQ